MKRIVFCLVFLATIVVAVIPTVVAADLDEAKTGTVKANCVAAQSTIQRIGRNDTTSRINRGRDYDAVLRLFYAMNTRAASNNITAPRLTEITSSFEAELQNFRNKYNDYNGNYKSALDIDCAAQPNNFYNRIVSTRSSRQAINDSIHKLDEIISSYRTVVQELKL